MFWNVFISSVWMDTVLMENASAIKGLMEWLVKFALTRRCLVPTVLRVSTPHLWVNGGGT